MKQQTVKIMLLSLTALLISACATPADTPVVEAVKPSINESDRLLVELPPRDQNAAICGLFIWQADPERSFILHEDRQSASVLRAGREIKITRVDTGGLLSTTRQYQDANGAGFSLVLGDIQIIESGTRYKSGHLSFANAEGWEKVVPVYGLSTCQS